MKSKQRAMKFGNFETLQKVTGRNFLKSSNLELLLRLGAISALLISLSSPVWVTDTPSSNHDYVIALDSSGSMFTSDIEPTRFDSAKEFSSGFIQDLTESTQVGLVSFSGEIESQRSLTSEHEEVIEHIRNLGLGDTAGTASGDAIITSVSLITESDRNRTVILVTDGKQNVGSDINSSIEFAKEHSTTVNTIGIGEVRNGTENPDPDTDIDGEYSGFPNLEVDRLQRVANETGGEFFLVSDRESFQEAFDSMETEEVRRDASLYLVYMALLFLLAEWAVSNTKIKVIP